MNSSLLPPGVRLDEWPKSPEPVGESLTVAELQGELRKAMPEAFELLEALRDVRQIQELAARLAGPIQGQLVTTTTTTFGEQSAAPLEPALSPPEASERVQPRLSFPTSL
jgi:hypothetical protein